jgi:multidrug efflux pump subunit AcrA (membrane-fusion protein)
MESELSELETRQKVQVTSLANGTLSNGRITQINPLIERNGLVKIIAQVKNTSGKLLEGMNVNVSIKKQIKNRLVVPKSAVLLRQNKEVVFVHKNGKAIWHYVKTSAENSQSYVVSEGLESGDEVIVSGNLNLAHESVVKVLK